MTDIIKKEGASTGDFRSDNHFLLGYFEEKDHALYYRYDAERVIVEPWGKNSLRVRASKMPEMPDELWALDGKPEGREEASIAIHDFSAEITNGKIRAVVNNIGKLTFYNQKGEVLLEEYVRNREDMFADTCSSLEVEAREFKPIIGGDYQLTMRFESNPNEKIYGMGQYQQPYLNLKGTDLELAHRNSQASVPFVLSDQGYGFLWHNPAVGRVSFASNTMSFLRVGGFVLVHAGMMTVVFTLANMTGGVFYVLIVAVGNVFVMALEALFVGIQVLRLEFYEIFSRFFDANGVPFAPLRISLDPAADKAE